MVPVPKNTSNFGWVDKWPFDPTRALNSETSYINVFVVHKKYIQEFDYTINVKTLWLVTVPKNVANFGLFYWQEA